MSEDIIIRDNCYTLIYILPRILLVERSDDMRNSNALNSVTGHRERESVPAHRNLIDLSYRPVVAVA